MTIKDLYNALEKAIDSGEATLDTRVWLEGVDESCMALSCRVDKDHDFIISAD